MAITGKGVIKFPQAPRAQPPEHWMIGLSAFFDRTNWSEDIESQYEADSCRSLRPGGLIFTALTLA
jgi:hypothetical protein